MRRVWLVIGAGALLTMPAGILAQSAPAAVTDRPVQASPGIDILQRQVPAPAPIANTSPLQPLLDFQDSDVKFNLQTLMNTLRDNRHEGWVLAAYPDPKTSRPLIGAGFSLDLPARDHPQSDSLNPTPFLEPSSAQLWQAAGLEPQRLETMLDEFDRQLTAWKKKRFRRKIRTHELFPEIDEEDAVKLLRISTIQAIHNARAYCRYFDQLNGPQQMALTQLVFQMGVNLEEFSQFLYAINHPGFAAQPVAGATTVNAAFDPELAPQVANPISSRTAADATPALAAVPATSNADYWKSVQETLIHSDWARRYSTRAISVIAMLDPSYEMAPWEAEARVRAEVHPLHRHRRRAATIRTASTTHHKSSARRTHKS